MSYWKLQQLMNCKSEFQRIHYRLYLKYLRYDLSVRPVGTTCSTATLKFMLRRPIGNTRIPRISTSYHNSCNGFRCDFTLFPSSSCTRFTMLMSIGTKAGLPALTWAKFQVHSTQTNPMRHLLTGTNQFHLQPLANNTLTIALHQTFECCRGWRLVPTNKSHSLRQ
jgi:hypothetical protein